jgi:hypothetical protein
MLVKLVALRLRQRFLNKRWMAEAIMAGNNSQSCKCCHKQHSIERDKSLNAIIEEALAYYLKKYQ